MKGIISIIALGLTLLSQAQSTTDHPTLKGNSARTGVNGDTANSHPGYLNIEGVNAGIRVPSSLRWFLPLQSATPVSSLRLNEVNPFRTVVDNTDFNPMPAINLDGSGVNVGPFESIPNGFISSTIGWQAPGEVEEAGYPYRVAIRRNANPANPIGFTQRDLNPRFPAHLWTRTTASLAGNNGDPRAAVVPANLRTFSWTFVPKTSVFNTGTNQYDVFNDGVAKDYALHVWIPVGPILTGGVYVYPQRYFAYEITYGRGQKYVDIVDTYASGGGWVRLGNGGRPTNQVFPYAGLDGFGNPYPLTITLLNTIPRNDLDQLTETVTAGSPDNRFAVFADAAMFSIETDSYSASPTSAGFGDINNIRVTGARNEQTIDPTTVPAVGSTDFKAKPFTVAKGVISSYDYNTGNLRWRYSPIEDGPETITFDETNPRFANTANITSATDNPNARGGQYSTYVASIGAATDNVTLNPLTDLGEGSYEPYMYVGGNTTGPVINYAEAIQYEIFQGGVSQGRFKLDLSGPAGYQKLGNRRYTHTIALPLTIVFENRSDLATDAGKLMYVDQVRFVGSVATEIKSTPVHVRAMVRTVSGAAPTDHDVVLVADERGRIHCLDANGNGDGTTTVYWTYPSIRGVGTDPNLNQGLDQTDPGQNPIDPPGTGPFQRFDGVGDELLATMATDFDLSTAVVQRMTVTGPGGIPFLRDYLFIGSKNGRVFSIAMEGRGDQNTATKVPGTTWRRWTYPETYPTDPAKTTQLGSITSVVYGSITIAGVPTDVIFAATEQGRMYALSAQGDFTYSGGNNLRTNVIWQYPPATSQTLNPIVGTPVLDAVNGRIFFGTKTDDDQPSQFVSLNAATGVPNWTNISDALGTVPTPLDWVSGAAYVSNAELNALPGVGNGTMADTIFAMNENNNVYAINALDGTVLWRTDELQSGGKGSLIFTYLNTFAVNGLRSLFPVVMVPTEGGQFAALFARLGEETRFGNRQAWGYRVDETGIEASMTVSNKWLYGATKNGYLLAWSDLTNIGSVLPPGGANGPGAEVVPDNNQDPLFEEYRSAEAAFLSPEGYRRLRRTAPSSLQGLYPSTDVITGGAYTKPNGRLIPPYRNTHGNAFEWGETIYILVYNFPIRTENIDGAPVAPPVVEAVVTTEGRPGRPIAAEARLFSDKSTADIDGGYAIISFPLTAGGQTSQVPGPGTIRIQIRTSATNTSNVQQTITLNPAQTTLNYLVANPIGIAMENFNAPALTDQLGYTIDPNRVDALANGSRDLVVLGTPIIGSQLGKSANVISHGNSKKATVGVYDRSLITLLRGEGKGLDLVRVDRRDLRWAGGAAAITKPFSALPASVLTLFNHFEDFPINFPNNSLDYQDIRRENIKVRKDPNGNVENPVFGSVSLRGPRAAGLPVDELNASTRSLIPTVFEFQVDVPRYQPANLGTVGSIPNQYGSVNWNAGYAGRFTVFVDSDSNGNFGGNAREAYRTFNLAAAVAPDERIVIGTPNVDLGSLSAGAGYDSGLTYSTTRPFRTLDSTTFFNPNAPDYEKLFKPFTAFNEGNVNLLNLRLAKGTAELNAAGTAIARYWPWQIFSEGNNDQIWIDGGTDLHSDIDRHFAPVYGGAANFVVIQKPRVGDTSGRGLKVNPSSRLNPNLVGSGNLLIAGRPDLNRDPRVGVSLPFGTPAGRYSQTMRVIEDNGTVGIGGFNDENINLGYTTANQVFTREAYSDPTFTLSFNVNETQLTGGKSTFVEAGFDGGNAVDATFPAQWANQEPAGLRWADGSLTVAFSSNRPAAFPGNGNANPNNRQFGIMVGSITGNSSIAVDSSRSIDSNIRDLNGFLLNSGNDRWANLTAFTGAGSGDALFTNQLLNGVQLSGGGVAVQMGGTIVAGSSNFVHPTFPTNGARDAAGGLLNQSLLVYVGNAKRTTDGGVINDSRLVATIFNNGTPQGQVTLDADPTSIKGRPTVVTLEAGRYGVIYPATSNGVTSLFYTEFTQNGGWLVPQPINFGSGFATVKDVSAVCRFGPTGDRLVELVFTGQLRTSTNSEVFIGKYILQGSSLTLSPYGAVAPNQIVETLNFDSRSGGFRSRGVAWSGDYTLTLADGTPILTGTAQIDRDTRIASYDTILGGRAIFDPSLGIVKFTRTTLPKGAVLLLSYQPRFIRLSASASSGYTRPGLVYDPRLDPSNTSNSYAFWFTPSGAVEPATSTNTLASRFVLTSTRGAVAGGQTNRPVMSTFRFGVRVGRAIQVASDGTMESLIVSNNVGSYQVDPAAGRIYFTRLDEDRPVRIRLNGIDITRSVSIIGESVEDYIPMSKPMNEDGAFTFLDCMGDNNLRRGMFWTLWSSSRSGSSQVFIQTTARKYTPILPSQ